MHFLYGTTLALEWPKQAPKDFLKFRDAVTNAMESSHLTLEVEGNLMIIKTIAKRSPRARGTPGNSSTSNPALLGKPA